eukprot:SAG31_NODE_2128_length_6389_cov_2.933079_6_plen_390_part_00
MLPDWFKWREAVVASQQLEIRQNHHRTADEQKWLLPPKPPQLLPFMLSNYDHADYGQPGSVPNYGMSYHSMTWAGTLKQYVELEYKGGTLVTYDVSQHFRPITGSMVLAMFPRASDVHHATQDFGSTVCEMWQDSRRNCEKQYLRLYKYEKVSDAVYQERLAKGSNGRYLSDSFMKTYVDLVELTHTRFSKLAEWFVKADVNKEPGLDRALYRTVERQVYQDCIEMAVNGHVEWPDPRINASDIGDGPPSFLRVSVADSADSERNIAKKRRTDSQLAIRLGWSHRRRRKPNRRPHMRINKEENTGDFEVGFRVEEIDCDRPRCLPGVLSGRDDSPFLKLPMMPPELKNRRVVVYGKLCQNTESEGNAPHERWLLDKVQPHGFYSCTNLA